MRVNLGQTAKSGLLKQFAEEGVERTENYLD
jgi:hypothetical protein